MTRMRTFLLVAAAVSTAALLAACADETVGSPRPIGAAESNERPREVRLDGRNPCSLVPESDSGKYYFERPGQVQESEAFKSPQCFYGTNIGSFAVTLVVTEGIEAWTDGGRNIDLADAEPVAGFPAITLISRVDRRACSVVVDVADGQYLMTDVTVTPSAASKVPEKCEYAYQLAESTMKGLVAS